MNTIYIFQYNDGSLSMIVKDSRELIYECAKYLSVNKRKYPVAIFSIKPKREAA